MKRSGQDTDNADGLSGVGKFESWYFKRSRENICDDFGRDPGYRSLVPIFSGNGAALRANTTGN